MVGPSTRRALNTRALKATDFLEGYAYRLKNELKGHDITHKTERVTLSVRPWIMAELLMGMEDHAKELRRYATHPTTSVSRSPHGFTS